MIGTVTPPRPPPPEPTPVPVIPSTAFLRQSSQAALELADKAHPPQAPADPSLVSAKEGYEGNALVWALRKVDESLDEIEANPPVVQKALYDLTAGAGCTRIVQVSICPVNCMPAGWPMRCMYYPPKGSDGAIEQATNSFDCSSRSRRSGHQQRRRIRRPADGGSHQGGC